MSSTVPARANASECGTVIEVWAILYRHWHDPVVPEHSINGTLVWGSDDDYRLAIVQSAKAAYRLDLRDPC